MSIGENVARIRAQIAEAALAAGRDPAEITLVAASKMNDAARVREAIAAGVDACGENRVQEMLEKQAQGAYEGAPLHFIGHLQKNKVRQVVGLASLIHGADSVALLEAVDRCAEKRGLTQDLLLEINIGGEASKSGFAPEELPGALAAAAALPHIRVRGLMCIPPAGLGVFGRPRTPNRRAPFERLRPPSGRLGRSELLSRPRKGRIPPDRTERTVLRRRDGFRCGDRSGSGQVFRKKYQDENGGRRRSGFRFRRAFDRGRGERSSYRKRR